jgi:leucyl-tRNA synthetase
VLFAFGFDAFGLPAELGAIAGGVLPSEWVGRCAQHMTGQLERLGFSFDWRRTFMSSDAVMYRWSQWLFVTLLEQGLIYRGSGAVDWCDTCQTTLATIQVEEDGTCWRCHNQVRLIQRPEWYLRVSAYLEENERRLADLKNWDETSLASQRFVLGRVDGVEVDLHSTDANESILTVFTPHADALLEGRFVLMSPKHPQVDEWASDPAAQEQLEELRSGGWERSSREVEHIPLVDTGRSLAWPASTGTGAAGAQAGAQALPVLVSPLVDGRYGATAVLGVPARDQAEATIARRLWGESWWDSSWENSPEDHPSGVASQENHPSGVAPEAANPPETRPAKRYKAGDFAISRQRSWGTPIPIVYCDACGPVPVPKEQLPVVLPLDLKPTGEGNPGRARGLCQHHLPQLRRTWQARDGHAGLPLRRFLAVDPRVRARAGARGQPGADAGTWGPAPVAALRASGGGHG